MPTIRSKRIAGSKIGTSALALVLLFAPSAVEPGVIDVGGDCTLALAIAAANGVDGTPCMGAEPGADVIELSSDVVLDTVDNQTQGPNGLPPITSEIELLGNGHRVERAGGAPAFRIFHVAIDGALELTDVTVADGRLEGTEQLNGAGALNRGRLTLTNTTVTGNEADGYNSGGGLFNDGGQLFAVDSVVSDNSGVYGGGLFATADGSVSLTRSSIERNSAGYGGGVRSFGFLSIVDSRVRDNSAGFAGGAILNDGVLFMDGATVDANTAVQSAAGLSNSLSGLAIITNSTLSGNSLLVPGPGGGIMNLGSVTMSNSTLSGNLAEDGAGVFNDGFFAGTNLTFSGNSGAIREAFDATTILTRSIVAGSVPDANCVGAIIDGGGNFDDDGSCPRVGEITGLDAVLADNGGPTDTHALFDGSSAIDSEACELSLDQRRFVRASVCDAGSYEYLAVPPATLSLSRSGLCPGDISFFLAAATPNGRLAAAWSPNRGVSEIPTGACEGTLLALDPAMLLSTFTADESGQADITLDVPAERCGHWVQVVDLTTCGTSSPNQL